METPSDDDPGKLLGDDPNDGTGDGDPNEDSMSSLEELARALANWLKRFTRVSFR